MQSGWIHIYNLVVLYFYIGKSSLHLRGMAEQNVQLLMEIVRTRLLLAEPLFHFLTSFSTGFMKNESIE